MKRAGGAWAGIGQSMAVFAASAQAEGITVAAAPLLTMVGCQFSLGRYGSGGHRSTVTHLPPEAGDVRKLRTSPAVDGDVRSSGAPELRRRLQQPLGLPAAPPAPRAGLKVRQLHHFPARKSMHSAYSCMRSIK